MQPQAEKRVWNPSDCYRIECFGVVGPTHPGSHFAARCPLYARNHLYINSYLGLIHFQSG